jgi:hypothetical protein
MVSNNYVLTHVHSEEQQPLENFFRAKGIKTKNEMADDVSIRKSTSEA